MARQPALIKDLLNLLSTTPTSWHCVERYRKILDQSGFTELDPTKPWKLKEGGRYYVSQGGSMAAFVMPSHTPTRCILAGAHSDSPALKLKPHPEYVVDNMVMLGLEVYGGPLLTSWLNRDLALAGRVVTESGKQKLVYFNELHLTVPQLAIHLDKAARTEGYKVDPQAHLAAVLSLTKESKKKESKVLEGILKKAVGAKKLLAHELFLVPTEPPQLLGADNNILGSYRLDNLGSVHAAMHAIINTKKSQKNTVAMAAFWDHEEIGSRTQDGAASPFLEHTLERIILATGGSREDYLRLIPASVCLSIDYAHSRHPGYSDRHEPQHNILLGEGPVVKSSAAQHYATSATAHAHVVAVANKKKIKMQESVNRGDLGGGSTIGPIHAARTGMPTVDLGASLLSMHSTREMVSVEDHVELCKLVEAVLAG